MSKCPYAKKCSGCQLQNLTYDKQLQMKQVKCIKLLGRFAHVEEIIGMNNPYNYRNKAQAAFFNKNGKVDVGIYQSTTQKIVSIENCMLQNQEANDIINTIKRLCHGFKIKPYDSKTGKGLLRHVLIRSNSENKELMVVLVTANDEFKSKQSFVNELTRRHSSITTIVHNINPTNTTLFLGKKSEVLFGEGTIIDELCGLKFRISPRSFYQINHIQTTKLYNMAQQYANLTGNEIVLDAYCGTGTIGLTMAKNAKKVIGVEINSEAVSDAKENARINNIKNIEFYNMDAGELMNELAIKKEKIDIVITDPPRAGCSVNFLKSLVSLSPSRIVYISCNPETLARDLIFLTKKNYNVQKIQPVDMFPHTNHVESVVCLTKRK